MCFNNFIDPYRPKNGHFVQEKRESDILLIQALYAKTMPKAGPLNCGSTEGHHDASIAHARSL